MRVWRHLIDRAVCRFDHHHAFAAARCCCEYQRQSRHGPGVYITLRAPALYQLASAISAIVNRKQHSKRRRSKWPHLVLQASLSACQGDASTLRSASSISTVTNGSLLHRKQTPPVVASTMVHISGESSLRLLGGGGDGVGRVHDELRFGNSQRLNL